MKKLTVLLFWWFLLLGHHPVVVGPFADYQTCGQIQAELPENHEATTSCWSDAPREPRR